MAELTIIGGGLAGSEAAWQAAEHGISVSLFEMRPARQTGAHTGPEMAELVCSNSLGSNLLDRASGLLKEEIRRMGSMLLKTAEEFSLPAGAALAVDRESFARAVTEQLEHHPNIRIIREEVINIPSSPAVIASGPLTSPALTASIKALTGQDNLFFFDAIAPVVRTGSIDMQRAFRASRFDLGVQDEGDYLNCPFTKDEYAHFVTELAGAERIPLRDFEQEINAGVRAGAGSFFEGCLPVEILASRGPEVLAYGPLRPIGLIDPHTHSRAHAVVQLRQDNLAASLYNLVGFQTNLTYPEQKRVFSLIPGLEQAEFVRYGQMHRNTFIAAPLVLRPTLQFHNRDDLFFAGQITGVEGYMGNIATGLLAGLNASRILNSLPALEMPISTMLGALCHYITHAPIKDFQPMKANFGLLAELPTPARGKRERGMQKAERALADLQSWLHIHSLSSA
jgi:methylenetetrahydrofolate--tRNA-(uracil-5-)-methyltransferase